MATNMYHELAKLAIGNFAEFKIDACLDKLSPKSNGKAKCICCLSYVEPKRVVDFVIAGPNVFTAICPDCGVPSILSRSAVENNNIKIGFLIHAHLAFFQHLHARTTRGCRVKVASYICDGINCDVIATVPDTGYGQTRLEQYKFETLHL